MAPFFLPFALLRRLDVAEQPTAFRPVLDERSVVGAAHQGVELGFELANLAAQPVERRRPRRRVSSAVASRSAAADASARRSSRASSSSF